MGENKRDMCCIEVTKTNICGLNLKYRGEIYIVNILPQFLRDKILPLYLHLKL